MFAIKATMRYENLFTGPKWFQILIKAKKIRMKLRFSEKNHFFWKFYVTLASLLTIFSVFSTYPGSPQLSQSARNMISTKNSRKILLKKWTSVLGTISEKFTHIFLVGVKVQNMPNNYEIADTMRLCVAITQHRLKHTITWM